jgi:hypothetical protein
MKFSMIGQEKGDLLIYWWLFNRGDRIGRFDWTYILNNIFLQSTMSLFGEDLYRLLPAIQSISFIYE